MKKITILVLALSFSIFSTAQIIIKGIVMNDSIPLESASVVIKNSIKGIATNIKGQFKIKAKKGDTLSISYIGYETKELVINQDEIFKIKLQEAVGLDAVVVNAFLYNRKIGCGTTSCYAVCSGCSLEAYSVTEITTISTGKSKLFPNPSSNGIFQLKLTEDYEEVKISVANISGRIIQNTKYKKFGKKLIIDLSQFSTGIYIINITADGKRLEAIKAIRR